MWGVANTLSRPAWTTTEDNNVLYMHICDMDRLQSSTLNLKLNLHPVIHACGIATSLVARRCCGGP